MFYFYREILRCIDSLQLCDRKNTIATPANWVVSECLALKQFQFYDFFFI